MCFVREIRSEEGESKRERRGPSESERERERARESQRMVGWRLAAVRVRSKLE